jgi:hypothetical protein
MEANETEENLSRVIGNCIRCWINGEDIPQMKELADNPSKELIEAYKEQNHIGWDQFVKGQLTIKWGEVYNLERSKKHSEKRFLNAEKWGKDIIVVSWKFFIDIWRKRNDNEHKGLDNSSEIKKKKLIGKIKWLCKKNTERSSLYKEKFNIKELEKIPIDNLLMMELQLTNNKKDRHYGGWGESLPLSYKK